MMFGIHRGEEISCGFVVRALLLGAPMHAQAVAETAEHARYPHGVGVADSA
jgi:hypothetical protein